MWTESVGEKNIVMWIIKARSGENTEMGILRVYQHVSDVYLSTAHTKDCCSSFYYVHKFG